MAAKKFYAIFVKGFEILGLGRETIVGYSSTENPGEVLFRLNRADDHFELSNAVILTTSGFFESPDFGIQKGDVKGWTELTADNVKANAELARLYKRLSK